MEKYSIPLAVLGALLFTTSFLYDIFFVGIPYQDPTQELEQRYATQRNVVDIGMGVGSTIMLLGIIGYFVTKGK